MDTPSRFRPLSNFKPHIHPPFPILQEFFFLYRTRESNTYKTASALLLRRRINFAVPLNLAQAPSCSTCYHICRQDNGCGSRHALLCFRHALGSPFGWFLRTAFPPLAALLDEDCPAYLLSLTGVDLSYNFPFVFVNRGAGKNIPGTAVHLLFINYCIIHLYRVEYIYQEKQRLVRGGYTPHPVLLLPK